VWGSACKCAAGCGVAKVGGGGGVRAALQALSSTNNARDAGHVTPDPIMPGVELYFQQRHPALFSPPAVLIFSSRCRYALPLLPAFRDAAAMLILRRYAAAERCQVWRCYAFVALLLPRVTP